MKEIVKIKRQQIFSSHDEFVWIAWFAGETHEHVGYACASTDIDALHQLARLLEQAKEGGLL